MALVLESRVSTQLDIGRLTPSPRKFVMVCSRHAIGAGQVARFGSVSNRSPRVLQHVRAAEGPWGR